MFRWKWSRLRSLSPNELQHAGRVKWRMCRGWSRLCQKKNNNVSEQLLKTTVYPRFSSTLSAFFCLFVYFSAFYSDSQTRRPGSGLTVGHHVVKGFGLLVTCTSVTSYPSHSLVLNASNEGETMVFYLNTVHLKFFSLDSEAFCSFLYMQRRVSFHSPSATHKRPCLFPNSSVFPLCFMLVTTMRKLTFLLDFLKLFLWNLLYILLYFNVLNAIMCADFIKKKHTSNQLLQFFVLVMNIFDHQEEHLGQIRQTQCTFSFFCILLKIQFVY